MRLVGLLTCGSFLVGMLVSFVVLFIGRFEVGGVSLRTQVQMRAPRLVSEAFGCDFCLCWWTSVAVCVLASPFAGWWLLLIPPFSTPIARMYVS